MYVKAIIILCAVIAILVLYLLFRGRSNGSGVQSDRDIVDGLKDSNRESSKINSELAGNSESRRDLTEQIAEDNRNAGSGIDEALGILKRAKERDNT